MTAKDWKEWLETIPDNWVVECITSGIWLSVDERDVRASPPPTTDTPVEASEIKKDVRRAVVLKLNTLYYRVNENNVEILSFFSNRQNPKKRKLK